MNINIADPLSNCFRRLWTGKRGSFVFAFPVERVHLSLRTLISPSNKGHRIKGVFMVTVLKAFSWFT